MLVCNSRLHPHPTKHAYKPFYRYSNASLTLDLNAHLQVLF